MSLTAPVILIPVARRFTAIRTADWPCLFPAARRIWALFAIHSIVCRPARSCAPPDARSCRQVGSPVRGTYFQALQQAMRVGRRESLIQGARCGLRDCPAPPGPASHPGSAYRPNLACSGRCRWPNRENLAVLRPRCGLPRSVSWFAGAASRAGSPHTAGILARGANKVRQWQRSRVLS